MKLLSIAVPVYNVEKYLARCLDSLLGSAYTDKLEILIINDGSKDDSGAIAHAYEAKFPNAITVVDKENGGHGSTINTAVKLATGKYFRVLDSDDWFDGDVFPAYLEGLEKTDADMIVTGLSMEYVYENKSVAVPHKPDNVDFNVVYDLETICLNRFPYMGEKSVKTDILKKNGLRLSEKTFYVDCEYDLFLFYWGSTVCFFDYTIYKYFRGREDQSVSVKSRMAHIADLKRVITRLETFIREVTVPECKYEPIEKAVVALYWSLSEIYLIGFKKERRRALREMKQLFNGLKQENPSRYRKLMQKGAIIKLYCMLPPTGYVMPWIMDIVRAFNKMK